MSGLSINGKTRIGLTLGATVFALATCELAARVVFPAPPNPTRQPQIRYRFDPEIRYLPLPNQRGWIDDGFVTTNSFGFRGSEPAFPKPPGRFRVVAVGDSVTFGFGVDDRDTFCAQTEQLLRSKKPDIDLDVVNIAVPGYDTRQEVALLGRYIARLEPNLVLVGLYSNDIPDSLEDGTGGTTVATPGSDNGQMLQMNAAPTSWWDIQLRKSRAVYTVGRALRRLTRKGEWGMSRFTMEIDILEGRDTAQLDAAWQRVGAQFAELRRLAETHAFAVGVVVLPPREQVVGLYPHARYQDRVRSLAEASGFFVIDPLPALVASDVKKDRLYVPYDRNHPSAAGHRVIAQAIVDDLSRNHRLNVQARFARQEGVQ
jgi:lysophospholipase L1-like esterase